MEHIADRCGGLPADVARSRVDAQGLVTQDAFKRRTKTGRGEKTDGRERRRKTLREIKYYMRVGYRCTDVRNEV